MRDHSCATDLHRECGPFDALFYFLLRNVFSHTKLTTSLYNQNASKRLTIPKWELKSNTRHLALKGLTDVWSSLSAKLRRRSPVETRRCIPDYVASNPQLHSGQRSPASFPRSPHVDHISLYLTSRTRGNAINVQILTTFTERLVDTDAKWSDKFWHFQEHTRVLANCVWRLV